MAGRSARRFMEVANVYNAKSATVADLTAKALYELAAKEDAAIIKAHMKSATESIISVGLALKRQKERLPHGTFLPWIEAEFGMSERSAYNFMKVANQFGDKLATVANLPAKALYELAVPSTPQAVRDQVEQLIVDGETVTATDVKRLKADAKAAAEGAEALAVRNAELEPPKRQQSRRWSILRRNAPKRWCGHLNACATYSKIDWFAGTFFF